MRATEAVEAGPDFRPHRVQLDGERQLACAEYGERARQPIIYLHGFLGSRLEPRGAGDLGANIIAIDRPGYGLSTPLPTPSLRAFGQDFVTFLDRMGIERCGILGVSAAAPFAIAAAVLAPGRVTGLVLAAPVADPLTIREARGAVFVFERMRRYAVVRAILPRLLWQARRRGLDARFVRHVLLTDELPWLAPDIDRTLVYETMLVSLRESLRPGLAGVMGDVDLLTRAWDIEPAEVNSPVLVMHGQNDNVVPLAHARWYSERLPHARLERFDCGHLSLVINERHRIIRELLGSG